MKTLESRHLQAWAAKWLAVKRPGTVRPFFLTELLEDFQAHLAAQQESPEEPQKKK